MDISIIITNYNKAEFLSRCIRSALNQKHLMKRDFEIIVIDDYSKDGSVKIIKDFSDDVIKIFNKLNKGLSYSRNLGIKKSKAKYVFFLDADDYISNDTLFILKRALDENSNWGGVAADYETVNKDKKIIKRFSSKDNPIACGIMYRKNTIKKVGMFNNKFRFNEDIDFRIRYFKKFKIGNIPIPLYRYTKYKKNLSKDKKLVKKYNELLLKTHKNFKLS